MDLSAWLSNFKSVLRPPYTKKDLLSLGATSLILVGIPLTVFVTLQLRDFRGRAQTQAGIEAESGSLSGSVVIGTDVNASGGKFIEFGTSSTPPSTGFQPTAPYYATFFYPWSENPNTDGRWSYWNDNSHNPPSNWFSNYLPDPDTTKFDPTNELYSSNNYNIFKWQLSKLAEAKQEVAISSWWGQGHKTDTTLGKYVNDFMKRTDNPYPNLRWAIYYEKEGFGNPAVSELTSDLNYIKSNYTSQNSYLKVNGKPVVFVYGDEADTTAGCATATRWKDANAAAGNSFYIVLKVFPSYSGCADQPSSWHQYAPATRSGQHGSYSYYVSPGFWKNGEAVRLGRDLASFRSAVSAMVAANATWKLTQTWNEWGEGSSVEPGEEVLQVSSGTATVNPSGAPFKNQYVDALNQLLPALESGIGSLAAEKTFDNGKVAAETAFVFTAGGDHGAPGQSDTLKSLQAIKNSGALFHIALGDMSYEDAGTEPRDSVTPSPWCSGTDPTKNIKLTLGETFPFELIVGNHEDDDQVDGFIKNFALCLPDRMNSTGTYGAEYYFDYPQTAPTARFINIGAGNDVNGVIYDYIKGNSHYNWLVNTIDSARAASIPWVVVSMHKNCLTIGNKSCEIGADLLNLLVSKKVDLVLQGHDHDYQRSKQIAHNTSCAAVPAGSYNSNCIADDGSDNSYSKDAGTVFLIAGNFGGGGFTPINCSDPEKDYMAKAMGGDGNVWNGRSCSSQGVGKGVMKFTLSNDRMDAQFVMSEQSTSGTAFTDSFAIAKSGTTPPPPPPPATCPTLPTNLGTATLTTSVDVATSYKVWSRINAGGDASNSYYLQVDDQCAVSVGDQAGMAANSWTWVDYKDGNTTSKTTFNLAAGNHTLKLIGKEAGLKLDRLIITNDLTCIPTGTGDNCLVITPPADTQAPTISITSPASNASLSGTVGITANASDNVGVTKVEFYLDNALKTTDTASPYSYSLDTTTVTNSAHTLSVKAYDAAGNVGTASIVVNVNNSTASKTLTFNSTEDATIRKSSGNSNYGTRVTLESDLSSEKHFFLKFNVSGIGTSQIASAKLRLYATDSSNVGGVFRKVSSNSWSERTLTWNNAPAAETATLATLGAVKSGNWYEVDVTSSVVADGVVSYRVSSTSTDGADFTSKEGTQTNIPKLIISLN